MRRIASSDQQNGHSKRALSRRRAGHHVQALDAEVGASDVRVEQHGQVVGVHLVMKVLAIDLDKVVVALLLVLSEVMPEKEVDGARRQGSRVTKRANVQLLVAPLDPTGVGRHAVHYNIENTV